MHVTFIVLRRNPQQFVIHGGDIVILASVTELPLRCENVSDILAWHTEWPVKHDAAPGTSLFRLVAADLYTTYMTAAQYCMMA